MRQKLVLASCKMPLLLGLLLLANTSIAHALVTDIVALFPNNQGDNGFYAQAYNPSSGIFRNLARVAQYNFNTPGQSSARPYCMKSSQQVSLGPCVNGSTYGTEWAILSWQVPQTGSYTVQGTFYGMQSGNSTTARIFINTPANTHFSAAVSGLSTVAFNIPALNLNAGDYLRFAVDAGSSHSYDQTGITGTITLIPEPGGIIAVLTGLVGLSAARRRKS